MARGGGSGSGMMIMVILLLLLSSSASAGIGGYFYMNQEDPEKEAEDEFKLKYQEAVRALEAEQEANAEVSVAKTALELAQEELEIARLAFEGKEFANEAEKSAARQRLYVAEQDVDTASTRLTEAETNAETAAVNRGIAEADADTALYVATQAALAIERTAVAEANALVTKAQGELDAAKLAWEKILGDAETYAEALAKAGDADRRELLLNAKARYDAAVDDAATAKKELETAQSNLETKKTEAETALIDIAETYASSGICKQGRCPVTLTSPDGRYKLQMQSDGNLVIYEGSTIIWTINKSGTNARLEMQGDGNLVVYADEGVLWASDSSGVGVGPYELRLQSDRNLVIYDSQGTATWTSGTSVQDEFNAKVAALGDGNPVRCDTADVGAGAGSVYRTTGTTTLRHYPDPEIASSWDPDWESTTQGIDCTGFVMGAAMPLEPGVAAAKIFNMPVTGAVTLKGGKNNQYCIDTVTKLKCISTNPGAFETYGIEQHGDKYAIKSGRNDKYCKFSDNASIFCSFSTSTDNTKFDIEGVGDGKYALKYNGKYCADEGDGGILCNRDSVGEWEKFTINQAHPVPKLMRGEISWQDGGAPERGGLIWKTPGRAAAWNTKYKFRCAGNGGHSAHSPEFGPVSFGDWGNPKVRVALNGQRPCPANYKLEVFEGNENITPQMKNFDEVTAYDGYDAVFYDPREKHGALSGNCVSKVKGRQADDSCRFRSASECENKGTCELV
jgi:hypothetical protein